MLADLTAINKELTKQLATKDVEIAALSATLATPTTTHQTTTCHSPGPMTATPMDVIITTTTTTTTVGPTATMTLPRIIPVKTVGSQVTATNMTPPKTTS
jgi:hypothetical protein